jgi:phospholipid/cholesterol/gamma-HCH transport system substrate-binding protein
LGSLHIELAPPAGIGPEGSLREGSVIPLSSGSIYPSTEQTLAGISMLLNGGGIGQVQDITQSLSTAFAGREDDLRSLLTQLDQFVGSLDNQTDDIIAATDSFNGLVSQLADQKPVLDKALQKLPAALQVLSEQREHLAEALTELGRFGALTTDTVNQTKENLVKELGDLGPVLQSLADAGPALTRSLSFFATFPYPKETLNKWLRGEYANQTIILDLTLSRLDAGLFTGTRFEGDLTKLEMQWGRTIGQMPSPYTAGNPLIVPYHGDQGP